MVNVILLQSIQTMSFAARRTIQSILASLDFQGDVIVNFGTEGIWCTERSTSRTTCLKQETWGFVMSWNDLTLRAESQDSFDDLDDEDGYYDIGDLMADQGL